MDHAERFRALLGSLGAALREAQFRDIQATGSAARQSLASSFSSFLTSLREAASQAKGSFGVQFQPQAAGGEFAKTLSSIRDCITRRIHNQFGPNALAMLRHRVDDRRDHLDLLGLFEKTRDENANSSVIRWLLDPTSAPSVAPHVLRRMAQHLAMPEILSAMEAAIANGCLSVLRERVLKDEGAAFDSLDRIDVLITGPSFLVAIENKIDAMEHKDQTSDYWAWLEQRKRSNFHVAGLLLSPAGIAAQCPDFRTASYLDLLAWFAEAPAETERERIVLEGYLRTVVRLVSFPSTLLGEVR